VKRQETDARSRALNTTQNYENFIVKYKLSSMTYNEPQTFLFIPQGNSISEGMQVNKKPMYMSVNKQHLTTLSFVSPCIIVQFK